MDINDESQDGGQRHNRFPPRADSDYVRRVKEEIAQQRAEREAEHERLSKIAKERWANLSPEEKERRRLKANETRRRNQELERQRRAEEAKRLERLAERASQRRATRRRELGLPDVEHLRDWQREEYLKQERKELKRQAKRDAYGPRKPTEWHKVPGSGTQPHEFVGMDPVLRWKRNERFWAYVDQSGGPDACWPWHGSYYWNELKGCLGNYGVAYFDHTTTGAHRLAWMLVNGFYIPYGLVVDHMCETPWCVNASPETGHLEVVTSGENNRRQHHREPEITRPSTSSAPPHNDRWYPFGRKKYDEHGKLKEKYRNVEDNTPSLPQINPNDYPADRHIRFRDLSEPLGGPRFNMGVDGPPLLDDDEEF